MHVEDNLYEKMRCLKGKDDAESIAQMAKVTEAIAEAAENNLKKVVDEFSKMKTGCTPGMEAEKETVPQG